MRTIYFNEEDIKQCKLALVNQNLTSLQSAFLMQYINNIEQQNNQLKLINKEHQQINGQLRQANKLLNEQYIRLYKEYSQLKDNWSKLKEYIGSEWYSYDNDSVEFEVAKDILNKIQELEQGSDSNE